MIPSPAVRSTASLDREALLAKAHRILSQPTFTKEDSSRAEGLLRLADSLDGTGAMLRSFRIEELAREMNIRSSGTGRDPNYEAAFRDFLRLGKEGLTDEMRALAVGTDSAGGFITPASFADRFTISLKQHDQLFDVATLIETDKGTAFSFPMDDDTGAVATIVAENAQSTTAAPVVFDNVAFGRCPQWRSGHIICSHELASDSAFPLDSLLAAAFARRFARGVGAQFNTTLLSDADVAVTSASPTALTGDEILDLVAGLDSAYAQVGGFLMNVATLTALRKLKASTGGAYLLPISRDAAGRPTLFDMPVFLSPSMPSIQASAKVIAFGDLSRFIRRQVRNSLTVKTYVERYATSGQIAYEGFIRTDGKLAKAANSPLPVRLLQCHS